MDLERNFLEGFSPRIFIQLFFLREESKRNRRFLLGRGRRGGSEAESAGSLQGSSKLSP
jgi:hypothetical protein